MTEHELSRAIIDCARLLQWRCAHFRPARTKDGWRTPVEADGAGWPDLVLSRGPRLIFAETKSAKGKLSPAQSAWLLSLEQSGAEVYVWRPSEWTDGTVEGTLR